MNSVRLVLVSASLLAATSMAHADIFTLTEYQTVDVNGAFPAIGSNNIDKFDTAGTAHNAVAPFDTSIYVRANTSTTAANLPRRVQLYLQFDLSGLTAETLVDARLEFNAYSLNDLTAAVNNPDVFVSQVANDWDPAGTPDPVYNPTIVGSAINGGSVTSGTGADKYDSGDLTLTGSPTYRNTTAYAIDVLSIVQSWQGGAANNGFFLELGSTSSHNQGIGLDGATLNVTAIPEPSTLALMSLVGTLLIVRGCRRK